VPLFLPPSQVDLIHDEQRSEGTWSPAVCFIMLRSDRPRFLVIKCLIKILLIKGSRVEELYVQGSVYLTLGY
jgi:hypothetical protein